MGDAGATSPASIADRHRSRGRARSGARHLGRWSPGSLLGGRPETSCRTGTTRHLRLDTLSFRRAPVHEVFDLVRGTRIVEHPECIQQHGARRVNPIWPCSRLRQAPHCHREEVDSKKCPGRLPVSEEARRPCHTTPVRSPFLKALTLFENGQECTSARPVSEACITLSTR